MESQATCGLKRKAWLLSHSQATKTLLGMLAGGDLFPLELGDRIRQNMPMAVPVLLTQEPPYALSCQMMKIFCFLPSLGLPILAEITWMQSKPSARNVSKLAANGGLQIQQAAAFFESKEALSTFSLTGDSWGSISALVILLLKG